MNNDELGARNLLAAYNSGKPLDAVFNEARKGWKTGGSQMYQGAALQAGVLVAAAIKAGHITVSGSAATYFADGALEYQTRLAMAINAGDSAKLAALVQTAVNALNSIRRAVPSMAFQPTAEAHRRSKSPPCRIVKPRPAWCETEPATS